MNRTANLTLAAVFLCLISATAVAQDKADPDDNTDTFVEELSTNFGTCLQRNAHSGWTAPEDHLAIRIPR